MPAIFEIMFGGRICGSYILTISVEKQRKCWPFFCCVRMGELRQARIPMRPAIGVLSWPRGYIFLVLAWLYMALLKQLLTQFEFFTCLTKQAFCAHRLSTLAQSDDKQPSRRQGGAWKSTGKNAYEMKVAVNAKKQHTQTLYACNSKSEHSVETKPPTAVAPASASAHRQARATCNSTSPGRLLWGARRTSTSDKNLPFVS